MNSIGPQRRSVILLVEDEPAVRELAAAVLRERGLDVLAFGAAEPALAVLGDPSLDVAVLVTDLHLPGMDGATLTSCVLGSFKQGRDVQGMVLVSPSLNFKSLKTSEALKHPFVGGRVSTMLAGGKVEPDIKKMYTHFKAKHPPIPADADEGRKHQTLWLVQEDTEFRGTQLVTEPALGVACCLTRFSFSSRFGLPRRPTNIRGPNARIR